MKSARFDNKHAALLRAPLAPCSGDARSAPLKRRANPIAAGYRCDTVFNGGTDAEL